MQTIVEMIRLNATMSSTDLRPHLLQHVPKYKETDASFIRNFRKKALRWIIRNPPAKEMTFEDANLLGAPTAAEEEIVGDSSIDRELVQNVLFNLMTKTGNLADVMHLFGEMQSSNPTFKFSVKRAPGGSPEAICWCTAEMRRDLLRFSDMLYIDMRKTCVNDVGWNYFGPTVLDENLKVRVVAECLCCTEDLGMYAWGLSNLEVFEPLYSLKLTRFMFADNLVTDNLLRQLNILETCTLRGDFWHLTKEVWPKLFGGKLWTNRQLGSRITKMVKGSREDWNKCYEEAKNIVIGNQEQFENLRDIYNNPNKYANWWLREHRCTLGRLGSTPAEQNHSSVAIYIGAGATLSLLENANKLLRRQDEHNRQRCTERNKVEVASYIYRSKLRDNDKQADEEGKKHLAPFAYKKLLEIMQQSHSLTHSLDDGYIICQTAGSHNSGCRWKIGERCPCYDSFIMGFQCKFEFCVDQKFILNKFDNRWWQGRVYEKHFPHYNAIVPNPRTTDRNSKETVGAPIAEDGGNNEDNCNYDPATDNDTADEGYDAFASTKTRYHSLNQECSILIRLAQGNRELCETLHSNFQRMTDRVRNNQPVDILFQTTVLPMQQNEKSGVVPGVLNVHNRGRDHNRKKSSREIGYQSSRKTSLRDAASTSSNNIPVTGTAHNTRRSCTFCSSVGHRITLCPSIHKWGGTSLTTTGKEWKIERHDLANHIRSTFSHLMVENVPIHRQNEVICHAIDKKTKGIVIHRRCYPLANTLGDPRFAVPVVECTLLMENGVVAEEYKDKYFTVDAVCEYIVKAQKNVIVNQIPPKPLTMAQPQPELPQQVHNGTGGVVLPFIPPQFYPYGPNFHQMSQLSQSTVQSRLGFSYDDTSNQHGFDYGNGNGNI